MKSSVRIQSLVLSLVFTLVGVQLAVFAQGATQVKLEEGTQVRLKLMEAINSGTAQAGQVISFEVLDDVKIGDALVIAEGATAWGTIVEAEAKKSMGRAGKLAFRLDYVKAVDGSKIPLRATSVSQGKGKGVATGVAVGATAVLFWPAAPLFLLMKGKNSEVPRGYHVQAFIDGDRLVTPRGTVAEKNAPAAPAGQFTQPAVNAGFQTVALTAAQPVASPAAPVVNSGLASVNVISDPDGAEIEIDGAYYGSTPSLIKLPAGAHTITMRSGKFGAWQRTLNIAPGSNLTVKAELQANAVNATTQTARRGIK